MIVRNVPLISFIAAPRVLESKEATTIVTRGGWEAPFLLACSATYADCIWARYFNRSMTIGARFQDQLLTFNFSIWLPQTSRSLKPESSSNVTKTSPP